MVVVLLCLVSGGLDHFGVFQLFLPAFSPFNYDVIYYYFINVFIVIVSLIFIIIFVLVIIVMLIMFLIFIISTELPAL